MSEVTVVKVGGSAGVERDDADTLRALLDAGAVPVLPPLALSDEGEGLNVDGDRAAAAVAVALGARSLVILTNVPGLLRVLDDPASLVRVASVEEAETLAQGRMKKKALAAREALAGGVARVRIASARIDRPVRRALAGPAGNAVGEKGEGPMHIALVGHIDTVPGDIPVRVEGDELVGRGAVDAKGPLAAFVAAATEPPAGVRVSVVGAVEEERPSSKGARAIATWTPPAHCVIGEPSGWDGITVGYKGSLQLQIRLERDARHGAHDGATIAEESLALFQELRRRAAARVPDAGPFQRVDCRLTSVSARADFGLVVSAQHRHY